MLSLCEWLTYVTTNSWSKVQLSILWQSRFVHQRLYLASYLTKKQKQKFPPQSFHNARYWRVHRLSRLELLRRTFPVEMSSSSVPSCAVSSLTGELA